MPRVDSFGSRKVGLINRRLRRIAFKSGCFDVRGKGMGRRHLPKLIRFFELLGFFCVIVIMWLDEILDLPHVLFGAPATPINWVDSVFEKATVALLPRL
jgi:hypothetical protein